jgi:hypothetical protein
VANGVVVESETKTVAGVRSLALDPTTCAALATYIDTWRQERIILGQAMEPLFVRPDGRPLHPDTITALFHQPLLASWPAPDPASRREALLRDRGLAGRSLTENHQ